MSEKKIIHIEVKKELHQELKIEAVKRGLTLKDTVILAIKELVEKEG